MNDTSLLAPPRMTPIEELIGEPIGPAPGSWIDDRRSTEGVLSEVFDDLVTTTSTFVSFSGGRDSSAILALAAASARRVGAPLPIPVTLRFSFPDADEQDWQEVVVRHLGLAEWIRIDIDDELDIVGETSTALIEKLGLCFPFNLSFVATCIKAAQGGILLTGLDGDTLFDTWSMRGLSRLAHGERRPWRGDLLTLRRALTPPNRREMTKEWWACIADVPWATPVGRAALLDTMSSWARTEPVRWPAFVRWHHESRRTQLFDETFATVGRLHGTRVGHPLMDQRFLSALAHEFRWRGPGSRDRAMDHLVGGLLPRSLCHRRSKGGFDDAFVTETFREFARNWTGGGVDLDLVNPDALQAAWLANDVDLSSATLAQTAWLHARAPARGRRPDDGGSRGAPVRSRRSGVGRSGASARHVRSPG